MFEGIVLGKVVVNVVEGMGIVVDWGVLVKGVKVVG